MDSYFQRIDDTRYRPTVDAGGAWKDGEIHFSPLGGLIVHAMDRHRAERGAGPLSLARVSFDILGFLAAEVCEITVETIRPGRTIELVEATVVIAGRAAVLARAWYTVDGDTSEVTGGEPDRLALPGPERRWPMTETWPGGYVASLEMRAAEDPRPGRATAWLRTDRVLVAGEESSPHAAFIALVDTANGIAVRRLPTEWMFPNLDLTIHLYAQPAGEWVGLDTTVTFGSTGRGLTSTALHDLSGPVGRAEQILTVRPLPGRA
ncbi:thioesterase family protein [Leifsonia sp. 21MFCrub1.1]|uniref:thioesterase family protein n=1 Tax=Leifsonia sp. 21MFCrub1.1 TaxID=1798223 RepID=UPI000892887C|nr:thioesterase family protein [Leifsonia sp. 21MFCrub1.1]SEB07009.1 Thioesterase-like superfamily protein [Leifsonia sp. 21MFCrub1.1]